MWVGESVDATITVRRVRRGRSGGLVAFCDTACSTERSGVVVSGTAQVLAPLAVQAPAAGTEKGPPSG